MDRPSVALDAAMLRAVFDRIYIINLPQRRDRRDEIGGELGRVGLGWEDPLVCLFPAVRPETAGPFPSIGARGCFLSHLEVIRDAVARGYGSILILEDDMDWTPVALASGFNVGALQQVDWDFLHGGSGRIESDDPGRLDLRAVDPREGMGLTHFIGLRGPIIAQAAEYLAAMLERPVGSPEGGPMHVDGAYSWLRKDHPDIRAYVCRPSLGWQRSSRSNVTEPTGWRATWVADLLRRWRRRSISR